MTAGAERPVVERLATGPLEANCYVVVGEAGEALVVDPGEEPQEVIGRLSARDLHPSGVLLTHGHDDHVAGAAEVAAAGSAPIHMHLGDAVVLRRASFYRSMGRRGGSIRVPTVDVDLTGVARLRFGRLRVGVLHTPGHTPGSVCFEIGGNLFTGDTLFRDGGGRTDLPEGDAAAMVESLALLGDRYAAEMPICPGHGEGASLGQALAGARARAASR